MYCEQRFMFLIQEFLIKVCILISDLRIVLIHPSPLGMEL
jgi:hypothetical protein